MKVYSGKMTEDERAELKINSETRLCRSVLTCMDELGIAPIGELTTLTAPKGNGKSAFLKGILSEAAYQNVKVLVILSEEKVLRYKHPICDIFYKKSEQDEADIKLENLFFTSMLDWEEKNCNMKSFLGAIEDQIHLNGIQLVVFDNFTTSFFGRSSIDEQGRMIEKVREMASYYDISFLCVFHTEKGVDIYKNLIDGENVRGNATSTNLAAYNYVLTTFFRCDPPRSFLHIDKARYHSKMNKTYWELKFEPKLGIFIKDRKTTASTMQAVINKLKKLSLKADDSGF